jgi:hypothetical protein
MDKSITTTYAKDYGFCARCIHYQARQCKPRGIRNESGKCIIIQDKRDEWQKEMMGK